MHGGTTMRETSDILFTICRGSVTCMSLGSTTVSGRQGPAARLPEVVGIRRNPDNSSKGQAGVVLFLALVAESRGFATGRLRILRAAHRAASWRGDARPAELHGLAGAVGAPDQFAWE